MLREGFTLGSHELIGLRNAEQCLVEGVADRSLKTYEPPLVPHLVASMVNDGTLRDEASTVRYRHEHLSQMPVEDREVHDAVSQAAFELTVLPYLDHKDKKYKPWPTLHSGSSYLDLAGILGNRRGTITPDSLRKVVLAESLPTPRPFPQNKSAYSPWSGELWQVYQVLIKDKIQEAIDQSCIAPGGGAIVLQVDNRDQGIHDPCRPGSPEN